MGGHVSVGCVVPRASPDDLPMEWLSSGNEVVGVKLEAHPRWMRSFPQARFRNMDFDTFARTVAGRTKVNQLAFFNTCRQEGFAAASHANVKV